jgi:hypothetical protein
MGFFGFGKKKKPELTEKQVAQRKYAAQMKGVRKRAATSSGGKGRIADRGAATKLRKELGVKAGPASTKKKTTKKKSTKKSAKKKR